LADLIRVESRIPSHKTSLPTDFSKSGKFLKIIFHFFLFNTGKLLKSFLTLKAEDSSQQLAIKN
jgi:hypothetical protein